jgi:hypothetical protein
LRRMDPNVPVSLVGYSFGARTIAGALDLLAGGTFAGRTLPDGAAPAKRAPVRAVLWAAAMGAGWLSPGYAAGDALSVADRILVTRNLCDPVLKFYPLMYRGRGPQAMGYVGPACISRLGAEAEKVAILPVECSVGRNHDVKCYLRAGPVRAQLAWYTLVETPKAESASPEPAAAP